MGLRLTAALSDNRDLHVAGLPDDLLYYVLLKAPPPLARSGTPHKNLRNSMGAREIRDGTRNRLRLNNVRFDTQVSRKAHVALDRFRRTLISGDVDGEAIGL